MAKNKKIYIVNGKETDEFGEEIKHKNRTGAKIASKTVSILLSVSLAAVLAAGAIIPASIINAIIAKTTITASNSIKVNPFFIFSPIIILI